MAHSLSAKKRIRQNLKNRARNRARKDLIKTQVKSFMSSLSAGKIDQAKEELNKTVQRLDKVAAKNTIHRNTASRKRSRLQRRLNALIATGGAKPSEKKSSGRAKAAKA